MRIIIRINSPEPLRYKIPFLRRGLETPVDKILFKRVGEILKRQEKWILRIALKYLNNNEADAKDVAQDLALELFGNEKLNKKLRIRFIKECDKKISHYFYSVIKYKAIDLHEKHLVSLDLLLEGNKLKIVEGKGKKAEIIYIDIKDLHQSAANPYREMHTTEIADLIYRVKGKLSVKSQQIIDLKYSGLPNVQIWKILKISRATYFRLWKKAQKEFRTLLKKAGYVKEELLEDERPDKEGN